MLGFVLLCIGQVRIAEDHIRALYVNSVFISGNIFSTEGLGFVFKMLYFEFHNILSRSSILSA